MSERIRFHLDENVHPAVAEGLRRRGIDVTTTQEAGLMQASDEKQLEFALAEQRTLVTHDEDFLALAKAGVPHAGITYCHPQLRSIGQMIATLLLIRDCMTPEEIKNHVEFL
jgi:uncharacterized protein with PIN domain